MKLRLFFLFILRVRLHSDIAKLECKPSQTLINGGYKRCAWHAIISFNGKLMILPCSAFNRRLLCCPLQYKVELGHFEPH